MKNKTARAKARDKKTKCTAKPVLTAERLRELLDYCPKTGRMFWKVSRGGVVAGSEAGTLHSQGRVVIRIDGRMYKRSRLAWLHMLGEHAPHFVDHKNGIRDDDRWQNLRPASPAENSRNVRRVNRHGAPGVSYRPGRKNPWRAQIQREGKPKSLGSYATKAEASAAYEAAAVKLHGEYAASRRPKREHANYVSYADNRLGDILADHVLDEIMAEQAAAAEAAR